MRWTYTLMTFGTCLGPGNLWTLRFVMAQMNLASVTEKEFFILDTVITLY